MMKLIAKALGLVMLSQPLRLCEWDPVVFVESEVEEPELKLVRIKFSLSPLFGLLLSLFLYIEVE